MQTLTSKFTINRILLLVILATAAVLRFWNFSELPFMYDELSALFRAQGADFWEVIKKARETDVHPVGVSVFVHYWSAWFGTSEMAVKLPFMLCSIAAIYYTYKIANKWFNATVALLTSACLASLQFFVMYGQMERPYATGLLFCTLLVWFWTKFFQDAENKHLLGFVITATLCAYNHYFSLLFAITVGLIGLLLINRQNYKKYLLAGALIGLLYLPHLSIFLFHFSMGGMGENNWLEKPHANWIIEFMAYLFHYSKLLCLVLLCMIIGSIFYFIKQKNRFSKMQLIALLLGISSFLIMYFYSVFKNPVLQYSSMQFSLPFLLMFLFSFFPELPNTQKSLLVVGLMGLNLFTLCTVRKHYTVFYKQPYDEMAKASVATIKQFGEQNVSIALNIVDGFMDYYTAKYHLPFHIYNAEINKFKEFRSFVYTQQSNYFVAGHLPQEYIEIVKEQYPYMISKMDAYACSIYCFSKTKDKKVIDEKVVFSKNLSPVLAIKLDSTMEYSPNFTIKLSEITNGKNNCITIKAALHSNDTSANPVLVMDIHHNDKMIKWLGAEYFWFNSNPSKTNNVYVSQLTADIAPKDLIAAELKVYVWNRNKKGVFIDSLSIEVTESNPIFYGVYKEIE